MPSLIERLNIAAILAVAVAAFFVPILGVPGYELGEALALVVGILGGFAAIAAVRRAPTGASSATLRCALRLSGWVLIAILVVALRSALGSRCDPFHGLVFALLLPLPSAFLAATLGGLLAAAFPSKPTAAWLYGLILVLTLGVTLWPIYFGPQAFAFNALLGWVPGPLYDEELVVPDALVWFRLLTLGQALVLFGLIKLLPRRGALTLAALTALGVVSVAVEHQVGSRVSVADLDRVLGGRREEAGLRIHYPRELTLTRAEQLWRNALLRRAQVIEALGLPKEAPVDVFFHRSPEEKGRLTGATRTHFTKPWLRQVQTLVDDGGVLRHELVHALAAPWASGPFGASGGILHFDIALTEGLAEAIDWPGEQYTLHQWSAGMRAAGLAPPIASVMTTPGFYGASQGRAYTLAGSFVRYLMDHYGRAPLQRAYRSGDIAAAYGKSVAALGDEWGTFLDGLPRDGRLESSADDRFRQKPLFARPCAREVAALQAEAAQARQSEDWLRAAELFKRCSDIDPTDGAALEARFRVLQRSGDRALAAEALAVLRASPAFDNPQRARIAVALGDEAWAAGRTDEARTQFAIAREAGLSASADRAVQVRLLALDRANSRTLEMALRRYLDDPGGATSLLGLREAWDSDRDFARSPTSSALGWPIRANDAGAWRPSMPRCAWAFPPT